MVIKAVLFIIAAQNFRDEELFDTKKVLESHKIKTVIAASSKNEAKGMLGGKVTPEILIGEAKAEDYNAIVFIGGSGASEYWNNKTAHKLASEALAQNKILGAICIAPVTIANAGILNGKNFTAWSSEISTIKKLGGNYIDEPVVRDGLIITANGPSAAKQFGKTIFEALKN